jgi:probable HAF family extracellular repeat protein
MNARDLCLSIVSMFLIGPALTWHIHAQSQGPAYMITDLGTLGGKRSVPVSINNVGYVVGNSETADGQTHAFLYVGGSMADLGTLGGPNSYANRISDGGLIVGRSQVPDGTYRSFQSSWGGQMRDLRTIDGRLEDRFSTAVDVNSAGHIVGFLQRTTEHMAARSRVFLLRDFTLTDLGTFGGEDGIVSAINDVGQLVGYVGTEPHADYAVHRAFLLTGTTVVHLGSLGGRTTTPTDINNAGQVVGFARVRGGEDHAFLYSDGAITDLGTLGGTQSFAYAINNSRQIVGASDSGSSGRRAFLYERGAFVDLNTLIGQDSGWTLTDARDINDRGQIIGTGILHGEQRGFLLTRR